MFGWCCVGIRSCTQEKLDATSFFAYTCCTRVPAHRKKNWIPPVFYLYMLHTSTRAQEKKTGYHQVFCIYTLHTSTCAQEKLDATSFFAYTRCTRVCGQACMYEQSNISIVFFLHRIFNAVDGHTIRIQKIVYTSRFVRVILAQGPC